MISLPTQQSPRIKYVKKASQWCITYFTFDAKNQPKQIQEWSLDKPAINGR